MVLVPASNKIIHTALSQHKVDSTLGKICCNISVFIHYQHLFYCWGWFNENGLFYFALRRCTYLAPRVLPLRYFFICYGRQGDTWQRGTSTTFDMTPTTLHVWLTSESLWKQT